MAKIKPSVLGHTSGTLGQTTFVDSKAYKPHVRARRGTYKPAVLNDDLVLSKERQSIANQYAALIFNTVRHIQKDGSLWTRLLRIFRKQLKEGLPPDVTPLRSMECSKKHSLRGRLKAYQTTAQVDAQQLWMSVELLDHADYKKQHEVDGYIVSVIAVFPDFEQLQCSSQTIETPMLRFDDPLEKIHFEMTIPAGATQYALFLGVTGCEQGKPSAFDYLKGLIVERAGKIETVQTNSLPAATDETFNPDAFAW